MPRRSFFRPAFTVIPVVALLVVGSAIAQPTQTPEIDLLVTTLFGAQSIDDCKSRVRAGFQKARYANITERGSDTVKGQMLSGDNAGVSSIVVCSTSGSAFVLSMASAGPREGAPNSQNARLLAAITKP